jgi:uncharacterized membrane protein YdjX (TVP38/TMEM64 family)
MDIKLIARVAIPIVIALGAVGALVYWSGVGVGDVRDQFAAFGGWAPLVYVSAYVVAGLLFVPATPLTLAGGVLFGVVQGTLYALMGAVFSAGAAFYIARYVGADWLREHAGRRLTRLMKGVEAEGWRFVAFIRLVPIFPFSPLNYGLGLTRINFGSYLLTTAICMVPGTLAYAYVGDVGAAVLGGEANVRGLLIAIGAVAALAFLPRLVRRLRGDGVTEAE